MKLTVEEIKTLLEEVDMDIHDWAYEGKLLSAALENKERLAEIKESLGEIKHITQVGGEGQGDIWYSVNYFPKHDVYLKTEGFYSSYQGVEFYYGWGEEVRPQEKTITVYE